MYICPQCGGNKVLLKKYRIAPAANKRGYSIRRSRAKMAPGIQDVCKCQSCGCEWAVEQVVPPAKKAKAMLLHGFCGGVLGIVLLFAIVLSMPSSTVQHEPSGDGVHRQSPEIVQSAGNFPEPEESPQEGQNDVEHRNDTTSDEVSSEPGPEIIEPSTESTTVQISDIDTSEYLKLYCDVLYEYGDFLANERVVTVITVKEAYGDSLKAGTGNNDGFFYSIICEFLDKSKIDGVKEGDKVTIAGVVDKPGSIGKTKTLRDCAIVGFGEIDEELKAGISSQEAECKKYVAAEESRKEEEIAKSKSDYIASCSSVKYNDVARNPDKYDGKAIKFSGKVIQVSEGWFDSVTLRVKSGEDVWYVSYYYSEGESRILEDDNITVYGECTGTTSYKSVLGGTITIPSVDMKYYS